MREFTIRQGDTVIAKVNGYRFRCTAIRQSGDLWVCRYEANGHIVSLTRREIVDVKPR